MVHITGLIQNSVQKKIQILFNKTKTLNFIQQSNSTFSTKCPLSSPGLEHIDNALEVPSGLCENTVLSMKNGD